MKLKPLRAVDVAISDRKTIYPPEFAKRVEGRFKRRLGDHFELTNFGVNLTELAPGAVSALLHRHAKQDEFIYVVSGTPTLVLNDEELLLRPGDCCGFKAGDGVAHQLANRSDASVIYFEVGDRSPGDIVEYPADDLGVTKNAAGAWVVTRKDGSPWN